MGILVRHFDRRGPVQPCFYAPFKIKNGSWKPCGQSVGLDQGLSCRGPSAPCYYLPISGRITAPRLVFSTLLPVFLFGIYVGIGNINYGLTMQLALGMSMGIGIAIGITLIVGTLMTPIINGNFVCWINTEGGRMTLLGVLWWRWIGVGDCNSRRAVERAQDGH